MESWLVDNAYFSRFCFNRIRILWQQIRGTYPRCFYSITWHCRHTFDQNSWSDRQLQHAYSRMERSDSNWRIKLNESPLKINSGLQLFKLDWIHDNSLYSSIRKLYWKINKHHNRHKSTKVRATSHVHIWR